jgi:hypothetical protein
MSTKIKFSEPKKIDYTKYIEPKKQIFVTVATGASIAILVNK